MGRRRRRYEKQFLACLLVLGPPPHNDFAFGSDNYITALGGYYQDVKEWWFNSHDNDTPPTTRSQFRFCKRYMTWTRLQRL